MSLVIRFSKIGRRGERKFRVVVSEKRSRRDGKPIDTLGFYEKKTTGVEKNIDEKKLKDWISKGAKLSPSVEKSLA